jgi:endonuclease III
MRYFLCVLFDYLIKSEQAVEAPVLLEKRLGHLDAGLIAKMGERQLQLAISKPKALHRFPNVTARWVKADCQLLVEKYGGRAENVWSDRPSAKELEKRFREFSGISQKKGSMAVNALIRDYGIEIGDKSGIDVSYDIHVRRVFLRSGLVKRDSEKDMVAVARRLNPKYPGALDLPAWRVGSQYCHFRDPACKLCVLSGVCPKLQVKVPK